jgi:peptide/nickel transport system substrate-binding protein
VPDLAADVDRYRPYCPYTINPSPSGAWIAPDMAKAEQLVHASGTAGAKVTVLAGGWDLGNPDQAAGRYFVSILDQLGYRASLRVIHDQQKYVQRAFDSSAQAQIGEFSWYQDFPAPSDFIVPLFTCHSFAPHNLANLNVSEFCNQRIDAEVARARQLSAKHPNTAGMLWAQIDRDIVGQAPWVPLYNPNVWADARPDLPSMSGSVAAAVTIMTRADCHFWVRSGGHFRR